MRPVDDGATRVSHVLMTADAVGGVWTFALDLARALGGSGVRVSLAVLGPSPSPRQRADAASIDGLTLFDAPFRLEWMEEPWGDVEASGRWLIDLAANLRPDVVHLNGYCHGTLPWEAPVVMTGHSCVLSWWAAVRRTELPESWARYAREVRSGLHAADVVTAPSGEMRGALERYYGPLRRTRVIPNGRSIETPPAAGKEPMVFTAGRLWDPAKNVELVCAAARHLSWPVYVAGDARGFGSTQPPCDEVRYLGHLPAAELATWMSRAAIYALPARYEPFGLSALEAALCGCALVLGDRPSLREVWGDAALYVDPDDALMLQQTIESLIEHAELRDCMARRARERARAFTPERMAAAYLDTYLELTGAIRPVLSLGAV